MSAETREAYATGALLGVIGWVLLSSGWSFGAVLAFVAVVAAAYGVLSSAVEDWRKRG